MSINYTDRSILKKFLDKKLSLIGRFEAVIISKTNITKKTIYRLLFKDVSIKGTNYILDHIWVPADQKIENMLKNNLVVKDRIYEFKGTIQKYYKYNTVDGILIGKMSYKIENLYYMEEIKK